MLVVVHIQSAPVRFVRVEFLPRGSSLDHSTYGFGLSGFGRAARIVNDTDVSTNIVPNLGRAGLPQIRGLA